jgi:ABC-type Na+ efflux pump permease subunit
MSTSRKIITVTLVAAGVAGIAFLVMKGRQKKAVVDETVSLVQSELDALDPVSRAAAVAKLSSDEVRRHRGSATA